jgi:hypothetical protein
LPKRTLTQSLIGITTGADGALWFSHGTELGRITVDGQLRKYRIDQFGVDANSITTGPDGALWLTDYLSRVGRVLGSLLDVQASFADATLTMNFQLGTPPLAQRARDSSSWS